MIVSDGWGGAPAPPRNIRHNNAGTSSTASAPLPLAARMAQPSEPGTASGTVVLTRKVAASAIGVSSPTRAAARTSAAVRNGTKSPRARERAFAAITIFPE
jgi:hypothetical protein